jgi:predicted O-methyltransferase YrrM
MIGRMVRMSFSGYRIQGLVNRVLAKVTHIEEAQPSLIAPVTRVTGSSDRDDMESFLLTTGLRAASLAPDADLSVLIQRCNNAVQRGWANEWPGEHYRLLPPIAKELRAELAIEVGTHTGMGSVALLGGAERVVTYDIASWRTIPNSVLREEDFSSGRVEQRLGNLADEPFFEQELETLRRAQLIFIDGPKDRCFEPTFTRRLIGALRGSGIVLMYDDIRVLNMLGFWDRLQLPKLDLTSLGHWSGTGLARL